jgi:hypothetical protein
MNASHPSHPLPGAPTPRVRHTLATRRAPLEAGSARRFSIALACLGMSYALAWLELPLGHAAPLSVVDGVSAIAEPLAAALTARAIVGLLYVFVALRYAWARWTTVVLGFASAALVGPLLPAEWGVFSLGALITGAGLAAKLLAALLLALPLRTQDDRRS